MPASDPSIPSPCTSTTNPSSPSQWGMAIGAAVVQVLGGRGQSLVRSAGTKGAHLYLDVFCRRGIPLWATRNPNLTPERVAHTIMSGGTVHNMDVMKGLLGGEDGSKTKDDTASSIEMLVTSPFPVSDLGTLFGGGGQPRPAAFTAMGVMLCKAHTIVNTTPPKKKKPKHAVVHDLIMFHNGEKGSLDNAASLVRTLRPTSVHVCLNPLTTLACPPNTSPISLPPGFLKDCSCILTPVNLSCLYSTSTTTSTSTSTASSIATSNLRWCAPPTSIPDFFMSGCEKMGPTMDLSALRNVTIIGVGFLANGESLIHLDLTPFSNVRTIGDSFLACCTSLTTISLSPLCNVASIGEGFMAMCFRISPPLDRTPLEGVPGYPSFFGPSGMVEAPISCLIPSDPVPMRSLPTGAYPSPPTPTILQPPTGEQ